MKQKQKKINAIYIVQPTSSCEAEVDDELQLMAQQIQKKRLDDGFLLIFSDPEVTVSRILQLHASLYNRMISAGKAFDVKYCLVKEDGSIVWPSRSITIKKKIENLPVVVGNSFTKLMEVNPDLSGELL